MAQERKPLSRSRRSRPSSSAKSKRGALVLLFRDPNGAVVTSKIRLTVTDRADPKSRAKRVESKAGQATQFELDLAQGSYELMVEASGFRDHRQRLTVRAGERAVREIGLTPGRSRKTREIDEDEAEAIRDRVRSFVSARAYGGDAIPADLRTKALAQKSRMHDPALTNASLKVESVKHPLPKTTFGSIGRFLRIESRDRQKPLARTLLKIPFEQKDLGWVDPRTLRVFAIDAAKRSYRLIKESGVNIEHGYAYAYVDKAGVYGPIGLPKDRGLLDTVFSFCRFKGELAKEKSLGRHGLQDRICDLILCQESSPACDDCHELGPLPDGLPECELIPEPPDSHGETDTRCRWVNIGPRNVNGRIRALVTHPVDGNTVYAGSANGGVWATHDAGASWKPLMHDEPALEIGALAVHLTHPAHPSGAVTIYAGTGEPAPAAGYPGVGVLKSTDSGVTWSPTGTLPGSGNTGFSAIVLDPMSITSDPATTVVYAGGVHHATGHRGGLFRSGDGGATWELVRAGNISGLALDPRELSVVYVAIRQEGIYRYTRTTGAWDRLDAGFPAVIPNSVLVAIGQTPPHTLYALLDGHLFASAQNPAGTAGQWEARPRPPDWALSFTSTQDGYCNVLAVNPADCDDVFCGGVLLDRYSHGAWTAADAKTHVDHHAVAFDPSNPLIMYDANDGGVYRRSFVEGEDPGYWTKVSNGLVVTQFNDIGSSPAAARYVGGGAQDNGVNRTAGGLTWQYIPASDGSYFVVDPQDPHTILHTFSGLVPGEPGTNEMAAGSGIRKSIDGGRTWQFAMSGITVAPFIFPILLDPDSGTTPGVPRHKQLVLFAGSVNRIYRTTDGGESWTESLRLTGFHSSSFHALALAPASSAIVYAGNGASQLWRSADNGATQEGWKETTGGTPAASSDPLSGRAITDIAVDAANPNLVYFTCSGEYQATAAAPLMPDVKGHVFRGKSADGGATWEWKNISSNLPDIPAQAIVIDPTSPATLYLGTDIGVFRTTDAGGSWENFGLGMPNVVVTDLTFDHTGRRVRAATYGRGMYERILDSSCEPFNVHVRDTVLDIGEVDDAAWNVPDPWRPGARVYWWQSPDIRFNVIPRGPATSVADGVDFDEASEPGPAPGSADNRLYVQVHNGGVVSAGKVKVKVLWTTSTPGLPALPADFWSRFPNDWRAASEWKSVDPAVPFQTLDVLAPQTPRVLEWKWNLPGVPTKVAVLAVVSSENDPVTRSDENPDDHGVEWVAPDDKHVALRAAAIFYRRAGAGEYQSIDLQLRNNLSYDDYFDLAIDGAVAKSWIVWVLLPEVRLRGALDRDSADFEIRKLIGKEAWLKEVSGSKTGWRYACRLRSERAAGRSGTSARLSDILIPARKHVAALLVVKVPRDARPGADCTLEVFQTHQKRIVGGTTCAVRVAPAVVKLEG